MWHRDKSVNRSEARKFFKLPAKEIGAGPPPTFDVILAEMAGVCVCVWVCKWDLLKVRMGTPTCTHTRAYVRRQRIICICVGADSIRHILAGDRSLNKLLGLPMSTCSALYCPREKSVTFPPLHSLSLSFTFLFLHWEIRRLEPFNILEIYLKA